MFRAVDRVEHVEALMLDRVVLQLGFLILAQLSNATLEQKVGHGKDEVYVKQGG